MPVFISATDLARITAAFGVTSAVSLKARFYHAIAIVTDAALPRGATSSDAPIFNILAAYTDLLTNAKLTIYAQAQVVRLLLDVLVGDEIPATHVLPSGRTLADLRALFSASSKSSVPKRSNITAFIGAAPLTARPQPLSEHERQTLMIVNETVPNATLRGMYDAFVRIEAEAGGQRRSVADLAALLAAEPAWTRPEARQLAPGIANAEIFAIYACGLDAAECAVLDGVLQGLADGATFGALVAAYNASAGVKRSAHTLALAVKDLGLLARITPALDAAFAADLAVQAEYMRPITAAEHAQQKATQKRAIATRRNNRQVQSRPAAPAAPFDAEGMLGMTASARGSTTGPRDDDDDERSASYSASRSASRSSGSSAPSRKRRRSPSPPPKPRKRSVSARPSHSPPPPPARRPSPPPPPPAYTPAPPPAYAPAPLPPPPPPRAATENAQLRAQLAAMKHAFITVLQSIPDDPAA